jgi:Family of unknown function (DUF5677)
MENKTKRIPCHQDILINEIKVHDETKVAFAKWFTKFEELINIFFEIAYLKSYCNMTDISSNEYTFYWYAQDVYTEIPCALKSCSNHFENGYYTDALGCCRTMFETLAKLKYFYEDKDSMSQYFYTGKNAQGKKILIKDIFEKVTPNAYKKNYSFLCSFVHKGFSTCLPSLASRLNSQRSVAEKPASFLPVPTFNRHLAEIVIKHLLGLISGYLNAAPHFLTSEITMNTQVNERYEKLKNWANLTIQTNKENFPYSKEWSELMEEVASEPKIFNCPVSVS